MKFDSDSLDKYCQDTFGHTNWEFIETKPDHLDGSVVVKFNTEPLKEEVQKDSSIFPFYDMWGAMDVDVEFEGMHPDKTIDFNIWEEPSSGNKFISFYGWDKKYNQVDSSNSLGFYELVEVESNEH